MAPGAGILQGVMKNMKKKLLGRPSEGGRHMRSKQKHARAEWAGSSRCLQEDPEETP